MEISDLGKVNTCRTQMRTGALVTLVGNTVWRLMRQDGTSGLLLERQMLEAVFDRLLGHFREAACC